jgi:hypothetical protein
MVAPPSENHVLRVLFTALVLLPATGATLQAAPERAALDFSTEPDETGDVFALSVESRYRDPISMAAAVADLSAAGMTCTKNASPTCTKPAEANGCTYTFVATVTGTPDRAIVRGETRMAC